MKSRAAEMGLRVQLEQDDDMGDLIERPGYRNNGRVPRRGSPIPRNSNKKIVEGASGWFQVLVSMIY